MSTRHIFSFGCEQHPVPNACVLIEGVEDDAARQIMVALHGVKWCAQYDADDPATITMMRRHGMVIMRAITIPAEIQYPLGLPADVTA